MLHDGYPAHTYGIQHEKGIRDNPFEGTTLMIDSGDDPVSNSNHRHARSIRCPDFPVVDVLKVEQFIATVAHGSRSFGIEDGTFLDVINS